MNESQAFSTLPLKLIQISLKTLKDAHIVSFHFGNSMNYCKFCKKLLQSLLSPPDVSKPKGYLVHTQLTRILWESRK